MKLPATYENAIVVGKNYDGPLDLCKLFSGFLSSALKDFKIEKPEDNFTLREYLNFVILAHNFPTATEADTLEYEEDYARLDATAIDFNNEFYDLFVKISPDKDHTFTKVEYKDVTYYGFFDKNFTERIKKGEFYNGC